jgi:hypothetical protein
MCLHQHLQMILMWMKKARGKPLQQDNFVGTVCLGILEWASVWNLQEVQGLWDYKH